MDTDAIKKKMKFLQGNDTYDVAEALLFFSRTGKSIAEISNLVGQPVDKVIYNIRTLRKDGFDIKYKNDLYQLIGLKQKKQKKVKVPKVRYTDIQKLALGIKRCQ